MWSKERIDTVAEIISGGTPARDNSRYWGKGFLWVTPTDITKCTGNYIDDSEEEITLEGLKNSSAKLLPKGTILLTSRATIGEARIAKREMTTNQGFKSLKTNSSINNVFLYYQILLNKSQFERFAVGSTFPEINKSDTSRILIDYTHNIKEQQKIATILETIDTAIEKTEELISKYEQIKQGMMQDLFTRGLDNNGKLRPSYEEVPELYRESELGMIPNEWDVLDLLNLVTFIKDGTHGTHIDASHGVPLLSAKDIKNGVINNPMDARIISHKDYKQIHKNYELADNDMLLTIVGTIGRVALYKSLYGKLTFQRSVAFIRFMNPSLSQFYYYLFNTHFIQKQLSDFVNASAQGGVYLGSLEKLKVFVMDNNLEVNCITKYLSSIDNKIEKERKYLTKLQKQKQGLMQDLLTGKIRVKLDEEFN